MVPLVLLAAGRSTRFGALKQVAPLGPERASILVYTIVDALIAGFDEIVLVVREDIEADVLDHVRDRLGDDLPIRTVHQHEPLGTAHATLVALAGIQGAVGLANGDDAYGREALTALRRICLDLSHTPSPPVRTALVGYPMSGTLSAHGGVSRGAIETAGDGTVTSIREVLKVRPDPADDSRVIGETMSGTPVSLPGSAPASMNLWALGPGLAPLLVDAFRAWRESPTVDEFVLTDVLDELRTSGQLEIRLAAEASGWFGVTFPADAESVGTRLASRHREGVYSTPLARMVDPYRHPEASEGETP